MHLSYFLSRKKKKLKKPKNNQTKKPQPVINKRHQLDTLLGWQGKNLFHPSVETRMQEIKKYNAKNKTDSDWNFTSGHAQWWSAKILAEHNEEPSYLWPQWTFSLPSLAGTSATETICMRQILIESLKHRAMVCKNKIDQHLFCIRHRKKCNSEKIIVGTVMLKFFRAFLFYILILFPLLFLN